MLSPFPDFCRRNFLPRYFPIPERSHHPVLHALIEVNCTLLQIFTAFAAILRADSFFFQFSGGYIFAQTISVGFDDFPFNLSFAECSM